MGYDWVDRTAFAFLLYALSTLLTGTIASIAKWAGIVLLVVQALIFLYAVKVVVTTKKSSSDDYEQYLKELTEKKE